MGYQEVKIEVIGFKGEISTRYMNIDNINYYRAFIPSSDDVKDRPKLQTMVYFKGSEKATFLNCACDVFRAKLKEITDN